ADRPDFQTLELLDRVRRREEIPEERMASLHQRAFSDRREEPELRKELRQCLSPLLPGEIPSENNRGKRLELTGILRVSRELRRRLATSQAVPGGLRERLERCLIELEGLE
ncbi:MAG: hypothetical protein FWG74_05905, partial [Planctomycetes bacterium]|nr:hypothetical protein [Planctomycetota bacterium]